MSYQEIKYETSDSILTITLNRPKKLNAFTRLMLQELLDALDKADADDAVKAIIFTGEGKGYCAGADLSMGADSFDANKRKDRPDGLNRDGGGVLTLRIFECLKPVIGAINGAAVGVGSTMLLPMDIRIASEHAKFGFVFAKRGIVPEACSSWFLPRIVGISKALEWSYGGNLIPSKEALKYNLISEITTNEQLLVRAKKIALELTQQSSATSIALTRQMMWKMLGASHPMEAHKIDSRGVYHLGQSEDAREGVRSFLEKRPAEFIDNVSSNLPPFFPWWEKPEFK